MRNDRTSVHNQFIENYLCEMSGYRNENTNILLLIFMIAVSTAWAFYQKEQKSHASAVVKPKAALLHNTTVFIGSTAFTQEDSDFSINVTIVFEGLIINEGDGYRLPLNSYVCPLTGVYYVEIGIRASEGSFVQLQVMKNSDIILYMESAKADNDFNVDTNGALIECNQGDRIFLQSWRGSNVWGERGIPYTTFNAFMLYQEAPEAFSGFTAWKSGTQDYTEGDTIEFNQLLFSRGDSYDTETSTFTCPITGLYYVTIHLHINDMGLAVGVSNSSGSVILHADMSSLDSVENDYVTVSNSRLYRCIQDDTLSVVATGTGSLRGHIDHQVSTFTVMLMKEESNVEQHASFVGFSAWKTADQDYEVGDTILFDGVMVNEGGNYSPVLSRYTCPIAGVYFITVNVRKVGSIPMTLDVEKDTRLIYRIVDAFSLNSGNVLSNSVLSRCFPGEQISVKGSGSGAVYGDESNTSSSFTIMLLHEYTT